MREEDSAVELEKYAKAAGTRLKSLSRSGIQYKETPRHPEFKITHENIVVFMGSKKSVQVLCAPENTNGQTEFWLLSGYGYKSFKKTN